MPANIDPIWVNTPNVDSVRVTAQQAGTGRSDGNGTIATDIFLAFTPGSNGSFLESLIVKAAAATAGTATTATSIRVYLSTQNSGATTSSNTKLIKEFAIPSVTAGSTNTPTPEYTIPMNMRIETAQYVLVGSGAAIAANTEFHVTAVGGDY